MIRAVLDRLFRKPNLDAFYAIWEDESPMCDESAGSAFIVARHEAELGEWEQEQERRVRIVQNGLVGLLVALVVGMLVYQSLHPFQPGPGSGGTAG
jgi:hypothetical protein